MLDGYTFAGRRLWSSVLPPTGSDRAWPQSQPTGEPEGAGGGSQPSDGHAPLDDDADAPARERGATDDDDEEFDDATAETDADGRPIDADTRIKKLSNALKRNKKKLAATRGDRQRLKELKDQGRTLDDALYKARQFEEWTAAQARNPKVRQLFGEDASDDAPAPRAPAKAEFVWDDSQLGFDPNLNQANRTIAKHLREGAEAKFKLDQLTGMFDPDAVMARIAKLEGHTASTERGSIDKEWNGTIKAAMAELSDPSIARMFKDAMLTAKKEFGGGPRPAAFFVDHYLKDLKVGRLEKQRASQAAADHAPAAQRQRGAEQVASLPRLAGQHAAPAPARAGKENLAQLRRRLTGQAPRG